MSEYHKIETLYERDEQTHRLKVPLVLKNRVYGLVNPWVWTEKIDGMNIRAIWSGLLGTLTFGGRTDQAALPAALVTWLDEHITPDTLRAAFSASPDAQVVLYGEGYGAGIQKGGGDYGAEKRFILFDVEVDDAGNRAWWLSDEHIRAVGAKLGLDVVPWVGTLDLADAMALVRAGFPSRLNGGKKQAEGLVGRPAEALFDNKGARLIVKLKTKDF
jgi:hypothetical protein